MRLAKVVEMLSAEKECVKRQDKCNRHCSECELYMNTKEVILAYDIAIETLKMDIKLHELESKFLMESIKGDGE